MANELSDLPQNIAPWFPPADPSSNAAAEDRAFQREMVPYSLLLARAGQYIPMGDLSGVAPSENIIYDTVDPFERAAQRLRAPYAAAVDRASAAPMAQEGPFDRLRNEAQQSIADNYAQAMGVGAGDPFARAAARLRAPYAQAAQSGPHTGLTDIANYFGEKARATAMAPLDALTGRMQVSDPETGMPTPEAMQRAKSIANVAMTGGIPFAQRGAAGIFGGKLAKTADQGALARAAEMEAAGHPKEDIWNATGWFKGADDKWRFEIPDASAAMKQAADNQLAQQADPHRPLSTFMEHPELYSAYPSVGEIPTLKQQSFGYKGSFLPGEDPYMSFADTINAGPRASHDTLSTILHESQHAVQGAEGFALGANTFGLKPNTPAWNIYQERLKAMRTPLSHEEFSRQANYEGLAPPKDYKDYLKTIRKIPPVADRAAQDYAVQEAYRRHAGEVESRNVQTRMDMTPEQRRAAPPWTTEDVPREQQIVRGAIGGPQMSMPPGGKLAQPALKVADDGTRINIAPRNMEVPEWGKGLTWGLTAYRSKVGGEDVLHVRDARLPPDMQGQGHGTAMYEHAADLAAKENRSLVSDSTVTQDAANRWMALNRRGYDVQMAPDKVFRPGPPDAPQLGRFETPDGSPVFRVAIRDPLASLRAGAEKASQDYTKSNLPPPKNLLDRAWDNYTKGMTEPEALQSEAVWGTAQRLAEEKGTSHAAGFARVMNDWYRRNGIDKRMTEEAANTYTGGERATSLFNDLLKRR